MFEATEIVFWRRAAGRSRLERVTKERIREIMQVTHAMSDEIKNGQFMWYGHVKRMPETRIPKQVINWKPLGRRKLQRSRRSGQEGTDKIIQERNLGDYMRRER